MSDPETAVVLLSGGMDSAVAAAWAKAEGYRIVALSIDYGQRHRRELDAAAEVARRLGASERVLLTVDLRPVGGSALVSDAPVPKHRDLGAGEIPSTYVPARNTIFLALALGLAEARGATAIVIGANRIDYSGYPDCRPAFLRAFERLAAVATKAGVEGRPLRILAPLLDEPKAGIVRMGVALGAPFDATFSCYDPTAEGLHCGSCDACRLRRQGFREAGTADPTRYASA